MLFGPDHLAALALTAVSAALLAAVVRRAPRARLPARVGLSLALTAATAGTLLWWWGQGALTVWDVLPFHLCDFLILVAVYALLTLSRRAAELVYFWGGAGTLLALFSPDVRARFPDPAFVSFFLLHGLVVVAAAVLVFGFRLLPGAGAVWRVFLLTNAYAAAVAVVNLALGTNYLYLRAPPRSPTLLDWLGPWPWYLAGADLLALVLFWLLALPWKRAELAPAGGAR